MAYSDAIGQLSKQLQGDHEAQIFCALSLLGTEPPGDARELAAEESVHRRSIWVGYRSACCTVPGFEDSRRASRARISDSTRQMRSCPHVA